MIHGIDQALIGIYIIGVFLLGVIIRPPKDSSSYIFMGRKLTVPAFVLSLVSTWYGGILEIGRFSYEYGIVTWLIFSLFYYLAAVLYAIILVPKISKSNIQTIPDAIGRTFGKMSGFIVAILVVFIASPAPYIKMLSTIIDYLFQSGPFVAIIFCTLFSVIYTMRGGFKSVVRTDMFQFFFMFFGFFMILVYLYSHYGGYEFLISTLPPEKLHFPGDLSWSYILVWSLIAMVTFIDPNFYQRSFAGSSIKNVQKGIYISILFWFVFDIMSISTGLYAAAIITEVKYSPFLDLATFVLPPIFQGMFIISMMSVIMSTIDSFIFVSGFTLGKDIFPVIGLSKNRNNIVYTKLGIIISGLISVILATFFKNAVDIWYVTGSFAVSGVFIPLLCSFYNKKVNSPLIMIVIPILITMGWFLFGTDTIDPMYPGVFSSFICFLILRK